MLRTLVLSACALALTVGTPVPASAQNDSPTKDIYFTFHQPVTVPTMTLPSGKYLFRHTGANVGRTIVQIVNADSGKLWGTLMTAQTARSQAPEKPEIRLMETPADMAPAVATWWYPGQTQGWEFIYPRDQATRLARTSRQPVLTTAQNVAADDMKGADLVRMGPSGQESKYSDNGEAKPAPLTGTAQRGEFADASAAASSNSANNSPMMKVSNTGASGGRTELPHTASSTPLAGLIGLVAVASALAVRRWRFRNTAA